MYTKTHSRIPLPCEWCEQLAPLERHHWVSENDEDVSFLCQPCHKEVHKRCKRKTALERRLFRAYRCRSCREWIRGFDMHEVYTRTCKACVERKEALREMTLVRRREYQRDYYARKKQLEWMKAAARSQGLRPHNRPGPLNVRTLLPDGVDALLDELEQKYGHEERQFTYGQDAPGHRRRP